MKFDLNQNRDLLFSFVILANLLGAIYGFVFYYGDRILSTPLPLVLFVPDCPLYVSLFIISILLVRDKVKSWASDLFIFISSVGLMKYCLWTMFVILFFNSYFLSPMVAGLYVMLFIAHFLAFVEVFVFVGKINSSHFFLAIAIIWLVLSDFVDYALGTHPTLPAMEATQFTILVSVTVLLSVMCPLLYGLAISSKSRFLKSFTRLIFE